MSLDPSKVGVQIAIPSYDGTVLTEAAMALAGIASFAASNNIKMGANFAKGCALVDMVRNTLVREFMETDYAKILFIDSDIIFQPSDILTIMQQGIKHDIVAATYPCKTMNDAAFFVMPVENPPQVVDGSLIEVGGVGAGFMLIDRAVFDALKPHVPTYYQGGFIDLSKNPQLTHAYFQIKYENGRHFGEDISFVRLAREHGFKTFVDLNINLKHVGRHAYDYSVTELSKQQGWIKE